MTDTRRDFTLKKTEKRKRKKKMAFMSESEEASNC
jgi:hypothetical protein